jgi:predicted Co/Zn/Cd cation transporter (cation efflux family)
LPLHLFSLLLATDMKEPSMPFAPVTAPIGYMVMRALFIWINTTLFKLLCKYKLLEFVHENLFYG